MKDKFKEYIAPTDEQKRTIWEHATIVFDTNILFNLYRYSTNTRDDLLNVMEANQVKIWMPYQVGFEYFNKREFIIDKVIKAHEALKDKLDSFTNPLTECFNKDYAHHPLIKRDTFFGAYDEAINGLKTKLDEWMAGMPSYDENDTILTKLLELYDGRVGDDYDEARLKEIYKEGAARYKESIPPGYKDGKTKEHEGPRHMYGDLIIWYQIMDYSKAKDKDIVLVTEDLKEDWWYKRDGEVISPRVELLKEFRTKTSKELLMYTQEGFLRAAQIEVRPSTTEEVKVISEADKKAFASAVMGETIQRVIDSRKAVPAYPANAAFDYLIHPLQSIIDSQKHLQEVTVNPLSSTIVQLIAAQPKVTSVNEAIAKLALGTAVGDWKKWYDNSGIPKDTE